MSNWRKAGYTATVLLTLTILAILFPISFKSATPVEGATKDASPSSLSFYASSSIASVTLDLTGSSVSGGSFVSSSSNASFSIETNNATGYTLNIKTSNDTTTLSDGNNHTIPSIETSKTASNFTNNAWGLLPSKYNGTNNTANYYPASSNGFTMDTTSSSNTGSANTYTVGLGLKADYTIPAGTYTNTTIVAEYVANPITYAIYYYSNTTDTVTGMPSPNPQVPANSFPGTTATTTNLASAPTRTGYTFLGWCLGTSSSSNITVGTNGAADTCASSSTNQFTAGQSFGINATGSSPDLYYFYAMWQANIYTVTISNSNTTSSVASLTIPYGSSKTVTVTPASGYYLSSVSCPSGVSCTGYGTGTSYTGAQTVTITNNTATTSSGTLAFVAEEPKVYMQDMTLADCPTSGAEVYDKRDESSYTVKKLADGYCWMTQNLALDLTALTQAQLYGTGTNAGKLTNASNTTLGYLKSGDGTTSDKYPTAKLNNVAWTSSSQNYYSIPMMVSSGTCNNAYCVNGGTAGSPWSYNDSTSVTINNVTSYAQGKIGIYYNYCAASAGSYCYGNGSSSAGSPSSDPDTSTLLDVKEDICPYGWHLPTSTSSGEFQNLYSKYSGAQTFQVALSTPLSGAFVGGKAYFQGSDGYFWSSTWYNGSSMYYLNVYSTSVSPSSSNGRNSGRSVRCVKDKDYMQSMTSDSLASLMPNVGDTTTLKDARDGQEYTVKKLADNKYWMTENLAIDLTATSYDTLYGTGANAGKMTNATSQALKYLKGTTTGTASDQWAMAAVSNWTSTSYSYSQPWIAVDSTTSGKCYDAYCVNSDKSWSSTSVTSKTINGKTSIAQGKIGVYYNYCAASAGSYCWGNGTSDSGSPSSDPNTSSSRDITSDICPYGWRLPTDGTSRSEFKALYTAYSSNVTNFQTALSTPLSGFFGSGKANDQGSYGLFWSSTWSYITRTYCLYVNPTSVRPNYAGTRASGYSVRCVFGS